MPINLGGQDFESFDDLPIDIQEFVRFLRKRLVPKGSARGETKVPISLFGPEINQLLEFAGPLPANRDGHVLDRFNINPLIEHFGLEPGTFRSNKPNPGEGVFGINPNPVIDTRDLLERGFDFDESNIHSFSGYTELTNAIRDEMLKTIRGVQSLDEDPRTTENPLGGLAGFFAQSGGEAQNNIQAFLRRRSLLGEPFRQPRAGLNPFTRPRRPF